MTDSAKFGTPWSDQELDAIVSDYFDMLRAELRGLPYVKSHHSAALMERIGRSHRSVEFKHQNISAVLEALGLPWIPGYKPKHNYQGAIFAAIDRYLSGHVDELERPPQPGLPDLPGEDVFVAPPRAAVRPERPRQLDRLVRKFDPAARDYRNRALGRAGEEFVFRVEQRRLREAKRPDLSARVQWVAAVEGDGAGYDILSFDMAERERLIEVKTTQGAARTPFFLTRNEYETAADRAETWRLYRVHQFAQAPRIFTLSPPLERYLHLHAESWRASFGA